MAQANLANNSDIVNFVKRTDFDDKLKKKKKKNVTSNKTKYVLVENEVNELSGKVKLVNLILLMKQNAFIQKKFKII